MSVSLGIDCAGTALVGAEGFEPSEWWSQSPLPYHLATPQFFYRCNFITIKMICQYFFKKNSKKFKKNKFFLKL